jgi:hypothetical protein
MPDPQTPNLGLFVPLNGADVGTWDVPANANFNALDSALGAVTNVGLTNVNVVLSPAQYACLYVNFTGTLTGNVSIQFPTFQRIWIVRNGCVANTTFSVNTVVNVAGRSPCLPPNETVMIVSDGTNLDILGLGRVGTYWDLGATTVPIWVTNSSPAPYLNCDGTSFSSATFPALRDYLGSNVLPDGRGRFRASLNQATGRLTGNSSTFGLDGNTLAASGGIDLISTQNLPSYNLTVTDPGHIHVVPFMNQVISGNLVGATDLTWSPSGAAFVNTNSNFTGITVNSGGAGSRVAPPSYVGGLTLIRAG